MSADGLSREPGPWIDPHELAIDAALNDLRDAIVDAIDSAVSEVAASVGLRLREDFTTNIEEVEARVRTELERLEQAIDDRHP